MKDYSLEGLVNDYKPKDEKSIDVLELMADEINKRDTLVNVDGRLVQGDPLFSE